MCLTVQHCQHVCIRIADVQPLQTHNPIPGTTVQDDHVSIGPLRLQLPDLAASASKNRATADDCTTVLLDQLSGSPNQNKQDQSSDAGATDKAGPASEDAPQDLGKNDQGATPLLPYNRKITLPYILEAAMNCSKLRLGNSPFASLYMVVHIPDC